jgi:hypothetical protein
MTDFCCAFAACWRTAHRPRVVGSRSSYRPRIGADRLCRRTERCLCSSIGGRRRNSLAACCTRTCGREAGRYRRVRISGRGRVVPRNTRHSDRDDDDWRSDRARFDQQHLTPNAQRHRLYRLQSVACRKTTPNYARNRSVTEKDSLSLGAREPPVTIIQLASPARGRCAGHQLGVASGDHSDFNRRQSRKVELYAHIAAVK